MVIAEIHTSDLLAGCPRRVQLRYQGKVRGKCTGALYRGLLWHAAAERLHRDVQPALWATIKTPSTIIDKAHVDVLAELKQEGRPLTVATERDIEETKAEIEQLLGLYIARFQKWFEASKLIGVEVPVRMTTEVDGQKQEFASHLDLLYRDPHGNLCVDDWKTGDDDFGGEHIHRSMQVGMYYLSVMLGSVHVNGEWLEMGESPIVAIIDVNNLKPYSRKTTAKDENGQEREFVKGDLRPLTSIRWDVLVTNEAGIWDEWNTRVRMFRAGLYPTNPTADGCRFCDSSHACPTWNKEAGQ